MSYKTNPILNRIKINKGWKNPYFPTKTWNYARDISLWFKVYLLLKFFLNWKKIQLVSFEIRFDQKNKKILYLRLNKKGSRRKKRKKKKLALNQIFKKIRTPIWKSQNAGSVFFLYKDLLSLKNLTFWKKNVIQKKILSHFWLTKPQASTWLNTLEKIRLVRQKKRKNIQYLKKDKNFLPRRYWKLKFYTKKQKQLLAQIEKIKKKNWMLSLRFFTLCAQKKTQILQKFLQNIQKEIFQNKMQMKKLDQMYSFLFSSSKKFFWKKQKKKQIQLNRMHKQKLDLIWRVLKKQLYSFQRARLFQKKLPFLRVNIQKKFVKKRKKLRKKFKRSLGSKKKKLRWSFLKNQTFLRKILHMNFLVAQMSNSTFLWRNSLLFRRFNFQTKLNPNLFRQKSFYKFELQNVFLKNNLRKYRKRNLRKRKRAFKFHYNIALWLTLRRVEKEKFKHFLWPWTKIQKSQRKLEWKSEWKSKNQYLQFLSKNKYFKRRDQQQILKHIEKRYWSLYYQLISKYYTYRLPYRKAHFDFKIFETNFQFKYLIQDLVQKYFSVQVEAKIAHVLNAQKNTNLFRLVFDIRKKKHNVSLRKQYIVRKGWNQKQIFLASRLNFVSGNQKKKNQKREPVYSVIQRKNITKTLTKEDSFLLLEKKILKRRMQNYFHQVKRRKDFRSIFKYLIPTLIDFSHSYEPQLLADILAKVVKKAKKQTWMLNTIKDLLQAIHLPRNVGYKIILSGRINSRKKSHLIYITQRQITLQVLQNNMNFAYAQANARIGAFGVKIWVYAKKI